MPFKAESYDLSKHPQVGDLLNRAVSALENDRDEVAVDLGESGAAFKFYMNVTRYIKAWSTQMPESNPDKYKFSGVKVSKRGQQVVFTDAYDFESLDLVDSKTGEKI